MSTVSITDMVGATAYLHISDDSPLAKAQLTNLTTTAKDLLNEFSRPVDQADIDQATFGAQLSSPSSLVSGPASLTVKGGVNSDLMIVTAEEKTLFAPDTFSPVIPIAASQCWVGFELDTTVSGKSGASAGGFGASLQIGSELVLTVYTLFDGTPLPVLKDAFTKAIEDFSVATTAAQLRRLPVGVVQVRDLSGSVTVTGSYSVPLSLNPLASADLPLNMQLQVAPAATAKISGSLCITGELLVRSYRAAENLLRIGVYKKKGTTFTASLTASAGVEVDAGSTDLLGTILNAALPGVDVEKSGIPAGDAGALNKVIADALDRSLAISLNAACSASTTHEAAVLYEVHLDQGDAAATDEALDAVLAGDWTRLGVLDNAHRLRDILVDTKDRKQKLSLNLFGLYSAASFTEYVGKCTILTDETGQVSIIDKQQASRISATTTPYAADPDKLRTALAQDFIATASYALLGAKLHLELTLMQDYLCYAAKMNRQSLREELLLGYALGVLQPGAIDLLLGQGAAFGHVRLSATVSYGTEQVYSIFFADPKNRTPHTIAELEKLGRDTMAALLDPADQTQQAQARIRVLQSDAAWSAMDDCGAVAKFAYLPELAIIDRTAIPVVGADWTSIRWWATSINRVAPALAETLAALESAPSQNPATDKNFMEKRAKLSMILGAVARDTKAAFVDGWGAAVIFALSGHRGLASMDTVWDSTERHFGA